LFNIGNRIAMRKFDTPEISKFWEMVLLGETGRSWSEQNECSGRFQ